LVFEISRELGTWGLELGASLELRAWSLELPWSLELRQSPWRIAVASGSVGEAE
jgi:hypothetical protein